MASPAHLVSRLRVGKCKESQSQSKSQSQPDQLGVFFSASFFVFCQPSSQLIANAQVDFIPWHFFMPPAEEIGLSQPPAPSPLGRPLWIWLILLPCLAPFSTFIFCCKIAHPAVLLHHNLLTLRNEFCPFLRPALGESNFKTLGAHLSQFSLFNTFEVSRGKWKVKFSIRLIENEVRDRKNGCENFFRRYTNGGIFCEFLNVFIEDSYDCYF